MKSSEFITEATNPRSYNKQIIDVLKGLGFKVDSREQSPGALKTWLDAPRPVKLREIVAALSTDFPGTRLEQWGMETMPDAIEGQGFRIDKQGQKEIFLAVFAGPKANEYAMGLDEDEGDVIAGDMKDAKSRQARLKAEVEAGMMPIVYNSSWSSSPVYTCGDLQELGWMDKTYTHDSSGEVDGWERDYFGPEPVKIRTGGSGGGVQILNPGETLD